MSGNIDLSVLKPHNTLNPEIWEDEDQLQPGLREKLLAIAKRYLDFVKMPPSIKPLDIVFTGSLAGYNYTEDSDVDIHFVVDYLGISDDKEFVSQYFMAMKDLWADSVDVTVYGHPVEMFVQDLKEYETSPAGQFSLVRNKWFRRPPTVPSEIDRQTIIRKAKDLIEVIEGIIHGDDDDEDTIEAIGEVKEKIRKMRKTGLSKAGEYAPENLVFKILRNSGYLEELSKAKKIAMEDLLSINEGI